MTGLKVLVVVLGVVLVAGFTLLFQRMTERRQTISEPAQVAQTAPGPVAAEATVALPPGARVVQVAPAGPLVDVLVERPDGTWDLMRVRRADGAVAGILRLVPAAP